MKLPAVLSPGFVRALPESERKRLGKAGLTPEQCRATFIRGQEIELQKLVANWLNLHSIYFEWDRTDKRTSGKRGPKAENLSSNYLKHYLLSDRFQEILNAHGSGSTAKGIKGDVLHQLPVVIPPVEEQRAIATALSDVDALLDGLNRLIAEKREFPLLDPSGQLPRGAANGPICGTDRLSPAQRGATLTARLAIAGYLRHVDSHG